MVMPSFVRVLTTDITCSSKKPFTSCVAHPKCVPLLWKWRVRLVLFINLQRSACRTGRAAEWDPQLMNMEGVFFKAKLFPHQRYEEAFANSQKGARKRPLEREADLI